MIAIVTCCHSVKLCTLATQALQSQGNGAVTRIRRQCQNLQPSQKDPVIGVVHCDKAILLMPLGYYSITCAMHYKWDVC